MGSSFDTTTISSSHMTSFTSGQHATPKPRRQRWTSALDSDNDDNRASSPTDQWTTTSTSSQALDSGLISPSAHTGTGLSLGWLAAIPLLLGLTLSPGSASGGLGILWLFTWGTVVWISLLVFKSMRSLLDTTTTVPSYGQATDDGNDTGANSPRRSSRRRATSYTDRPTSSASSVTWEDAVRYHQEHNDIIKSKGSRLHHAQTLAKAENADKPKNMALRPRLVVVHQQKQEKEQCPEEEGGEQPRHGTRTLSMDLPIGPSRPRRGTTSSPDPMSVEWAGKYRGYMYTSDGVGRDYYAYGTASRRKDMLRARTRLSFQG